MKKLDELGRNVRFSKRNTGGAEEILNGVTVFHRATTEKNVIVLVDGKVGRGRELLQKRECRTTRLDGQSIDQLLQTPDLVRFILLDRFCVLCLEMFRVFLIGLFVSWQLFSLEIWRGLFWNGGRVWWRLNRHWVLLLLLLAQGLIVDFIQHN